MLPSGLELVDLSEDSADDARFWDWRNPDPEMCDWHKNPYVSAWLTLVGRSGILKTYHSFCDVFDWNHSFVQVRLLVFTSSIWEILQCTFGFNRYLMDR